MADLTGVTGYVTVNGAPYAFSKWKLGIKCGLPNLTNFLTQGFKKNGRGVKGATVTVSGPFDAGMPVVSGVVYQFTLGWDAGLAFTLNARVGQEDLDNDVESNPNASFTAESTGPFSVQVGIG